MLSLAAEVSRDQASELFRQRLRTGFRWSRSRRSPVALRLERVWMPYYLLEFSVLSKDVAHGVTVSVDGCAGEFSQFDEASVLRTEAIDDEHYAPKLSEEEALTIGKRELTNVVLRQRSRGEKPRIGDLQSTRLLLYPFWVYYYERRRGKIDIAVLDAVTGAKGGAKTKIALLEAFVSRSHKESTNPD